MREVYIVEAARSAIGRGAPDGALHSIHPVDLLAMTLAEVVQRGGAKREWIEDAVAGCASPSDAQGADIARLALLKAGFPASVPGVQVNRICGSGEQAVHFASQAVAAGDMDLVLAAGVEMASHVPFDAPNETLARHYGGRFPRRVDDPGACADRLAAKYRLTREEVDAWAARSRERAAAAVAAGVFDAQIMPVETRPNGATRVVARDELPGDGMTRERLAALPPLYARDGVVTRGNSAPSADAAAALLLASDAGAAAHGLRRRARIVSRVVAGADPEVGLEAPVNAAARALDRAGLDIDDMDAIEVNEAFAAVALAWAREVRAPLERVNPNGGAIAFGNPVGASGAVLMTRLVHELERTGGRFGLQTIGIGCGMATATLIERVD